MRTRRPRLSRTLGDPWPRPGRPDGQPGGRKPRNLWPLLGIPVIVALMTWAISYFGPGLAHSISALTERPSTPRAAPTTTATPTSAAPAAPFSLTSSTPSSDTSTAPSSSTPSISDAYPSCAQLAPFAVCSVTLDGSPSYLTRQPMDVSQIPLCDGFETTTEADEWQQWQQDNAVDAGSYLITVNLLVQQDVIVNVQNVDIVRDAVQPAPDGDVLQCAGGLAPTYVIDADLSTDPPTMRYSCPTTCVGSDSSDGFSIDATQGDTITIEIFILPGANSLDTWHGSMGLMVGVENAVLQFGSHQLADYSANQPTYSVDSDTPPYYVREN